MLSPRSNGYLTTYIFLHQYTSHHPSCLIHSSTHLLPIAHVLMSVQSPVHTSWTIDELFAFPKAMTDSFNAGDYERINSVLSKYVTEGTYDWLIDWLTPPQAIRRLTSHHLTHWNISFSNAFFQDCILRTPSLSSDVVGRESVAHMLFALLDDHPDAVMMWNGSCHSPVLSFLFLFCSVPTTV